MVGYGLDSIQTVQSDRFLIYPTVFQPFGSNQTHIPPFSVYPTVFQRNPTIWIDSNPYPTIFDLSNPFWNIQPFFYLSYHLLWSDQFWMYQITVGYPKNGWIWISRKPSLVEQNGQKKCHPGYPFGVPKVAYRFRCSSIQRYNLNLISNHFFYPTIWTENGEIWVWINPNGWIT